MSLSDTNDLNTNSIMQGDVKHKTIPVVRSVSFDYRLKFSPLPLFWKTVSSLQFLFSRSFANIQSLMLISAWNYLAF